MTTAAPISPARRAALSVVAMVATIMQVLDSTIANVALPHMQAALSATLESVAWVLTSYMLASAIATPLTGWLENWMGRRNLFTLCAGGFTLASMMCGAAPTLTAMVAGRVFQGLFGALLLPLSQATMLDIYPVEKRASAITMWSMGSMLGPISGPFIGGWITESFNWRWIFYVNVPIGLACTVALWLLLDPGRGARRRFDMFGFSLLATALASLQLLLDRGTLLDWFDSTEIVIEAGITLGAFWMFIVHTMTAPAPLIPRGLFRDRNFVATNLLGIIVIGVMYSSQALMAPMLQVLLRYNTEQAGTLMMPRGAAAMMAMLVSGRLSNRIDPRIVIAFGVGLVIVAQLMMSRFDLVMDSRPVIIAGILQGTGTGLAGIPMMMITFSTVPAAIRTDATAIFGLIRSLSASTAIAFCGVLLARNTQISHSDLGTRVTMQSLPLLDQRLVDQLGRAGGMAAAMVDAEVNRQALMIAYLNDFRLMMWAALLILPLVLLFRPARNGGEAAPVVE
jgi:DHA2 family multidrug resistance protein